MTTLETVIVMAGLAAMTGIVFFLRRRVLPGSNVRLMRCPETGALAFVDAGRTARGEGAAAEPTVQSCELWPDRKDCARGCLARYDETTPGYRINVEALRPFDRKS